MSAPQIRALADEITYTWPEANVQLAFTRLRETERGSIRGFLSVRTLEPAGRIWWVQANLTTATDRDRLCKKLDGFGRSAKDWERDIDRAFEDAAEKTLLIPEPTVLADVQAPPDAHYLIRPLAFAGQVNMVLADQGSTKSILLLYLAICISAGVPTIWGKPSISGPVIYYDWEVDELLTKRRAEWICRGLGIDVPRALRYQNMATRGRLMDRGGDMRQQLAQLEAVAAVIDSLTFGAGGDLNSTEIAAPTVAAIGGLGNAVTKFVAAHPPKSARRPEARQDEVSAIGSALFELRARMNWRLQAPPLHERGSNFVVAMTQRKVSEDTTDQTLFYRVVFDRAARETRFEIAHPVDADQALAQRAMSNPERILEYLARHGHQANTSQLEKALGIKANALRTTCGRLVEQGKLIKLGGDTEGGTAVWALSGSSQVATNGHLPW